MKILNQNPALYLNMEPYQIRRRANHSTVIFCSDGEKHTEECDNNIKTELG
jgi:hypothetical protein